MREKPRSISVYISMKDYERLKEIAINENRSMSNLFSSLIKNFLKEDIE